MTMENKVSIPNLMQLAKTLAAQGNYPLATALKEVAEEITVARSEIVKLKGTIREIRSIANLSIMVVSESNVPPPL
jgi:hypothetical protein